MKRAFTLIELMVVVVVLVTLMTIMFKISGIGADADRRNRTIVRMQRLENCLSGYYAAFGSYPPVKLHGTRDIYQAVGAHGIQTDRRNTSLWNWNPQMFVDGKYQQAEAEAWRQVQAACRAQPVACRFPYPRGYSELIRTVSDEMKERAASGDDEYKEYWENESRREKLMAGFDDGGAESGSTGRFDSNKNEVDWRKIQLFKFGLMSYLLPRYLVMMNGADDFFNGSFAQWSENNVLPCDPFTGEEYNSWQEVKGYVDNYGGNQRNRTALARLAGIPSQAVCARWMPNLEGTCHCNHSFNLFGIEIYSGNSSELRSDNYDIEIFSPNDESGGSVKDQYILDGVTVQDGWWREFYYYSPEPHQKYTLWSAGPNGRTFPPWVPRDDSKMNQCVAVWTVDDIIHMSN